MTASPVVSPLVATVVVNWNSTEMTVELLGSLARSRYRPIVPIVIDNGSRDQPEFLRRLEAVFPDARVIANATNLGYAAACNEGIALALELGAGYVFLLNSDVVVDEDAVTELIRVLTAHPVAGAATPVIWHAADRGRVYFAGGLLRLGLRPLLDHEEVEPGMLRADSPVRETTWLNGAALLVSRACILRVGMLDTDYFLYLEDVDWSCRARRSGFTLLVAPGARVWHRVSASTSTSPIEALYYQERNRQLFFERWGTWRLRCGNWTKVLCRLAVSVVRKPTTPELEVRLLAYRDYLFRRLGARKGFFV